MDNNFRVARPIFISAQLLPQSLCLGFSLCRGAVNGRRLRRRLLLLDGRRSRLLSGLVDVRGSPRVDLLDGMMWMKLSEIGGIIQ